MTEQERDVNAKRALSDEAEGPLIDISTDPIFWGKDVHSAFLVALQLQPIERKFSRRRMCWVVRWVTPALHLRHGGESNDVETDSL